jgi:hypothetical protein
MTVGVATSYDLDNREVPSSNPSNATNSHFYILPIMMLRPNQSSNQCISERFPCYKAPEM